MRQMLDSYGATSLAISVNLDAPRGSSRFSLRWILNRTRATRSIHKDHPWNKCIFNRQMMKYIAFFFMPYTRIHLLIEK